MRTLKNDKFRRARGGKAFIVRISCLSCGNNILTYQKDGDGALKRCYFNRILEPIELEKLQHDPKIHCPELAPKLICSKCKVVIGAPIRHFDGRLAFRLRQGYFIKRRLVI